MHLSISPEFADISDPYCRFAGLLLYCNFGAAKLVKQFELNNFLLCPSSLLDVDKFLHLSNARWTV
jgi:hypothetical protein